MATCNLCTDHPANEEILDHLRVMHPEQFGDGPERWPDGGVVVLDSTLTAEEFGA